MKSAAPTLDHLDGVSHRAVAGDDDRDDRWIRVSAALITSRPSTPGKRRSETMTSKANVSSALRASSPFVACVTSNPRRTAAPTRLPSARLLVYEEQMSFGFRHLRSSTCRGAAGRGIDCQSIDALLLGCQQPIWPARLIPQRLAPIHTFGGKPLWNGKQSAS